VSDKRLSGAILAGGQSSRMGENKAFVTVGGVPIIERVIAQVRPLVSELTIITNTPDRYEHLGLPLHRDILPGKASLGGLYTAIETAAADYTLVVSCDQPFLNPDLLRYLNSLRQGYDVIVPLNRDDYPQSMHAIYGKACAVPIRQRLEADRLKVIGFFPDVKVREVRSEEIDRYDSQRWSFINVNTPEDLDRARELAPLIDRSAEE
jgi:molybdopterin-guanine dinucleotide biosynthesis protein A